MLLELHLTNEEDLSGLPEFVREAAVSTAKEKNRKDDIHPSANHYVPFMKYADNRNT